MKEKILNKSAELFLEYGFKSVTMDEIATELAVSKKTIYTYFNNKSKLVEEVSKFVTHQIHQQIDTVIAQQLNPIDELFEIKRTVMKRLKDEKSSPQYQLEKYYPEIYQWCRKSQFNKMLDCVKDNVNRGISGGWYRPEIHRIFTVRIYISGMFNLKDEAFFKATDLSQKQLYEEFLKYHMRSIVTDQGLERLKEIEKNQ
ncbi:MAG: TetR/AcrR family transcriptional regulator [Flavobacteriaceae bacterium]|nr:TetR/AcrR family transcriptional regulator [Flavobacteriaceae bacterium]